MELEPAVQPDPSSPEEFCASLAALLLRPGLTDDEIAAACQTAAASGLSAVLVHPADAGAALRYLDGSGTRVAAAAGYPHGASTTAAKLYEARDLLRRGVREIAFVLNTGKLVSRQFPYVETELIQIGRSCQESGALLHAIADAGYLAEDLRVIALKICMRAEAGLVSCSCGVGPLPDLPPTLALFGRILRQQCRPGVIQPRLSLDEALAVWRLGARRICCENASGLAAEWRARCTQTAGPGLAG